MATISLLWKSGRKLGVNQVRQIILQDHPGSGAPRLGVPAEPQSIPLQGQDRQPCPCCTSQHLNSDISTRGPFQGPPQLLSQLLGTLVLGVVFPARLNPFIAK